MALSLYDFWSRLLCQRFAADRHCCPFHTSLRAERCVFRGWWSQIHQLVGGWQAKCQRPESRQRYQLQARSFMIVCVSFSVWGILSKHPKGALRESPIGISYSTHAPQWNLRHHCIRRDRRRPVGKSATSWDSHDFHPSLLLVALPLAVSSLGYLG